MQRLETLREVDPSHYKSHFSSITHDVVCAGPPAATLRLHFIRPDASGQPRFRELARLLVRYITHYCFTAERRRSLSETERNEAFMQARDLFRRPPSEGRVKATGQAGELLLYFLIDTVLEAPQALKKMPMTTNPGEERKGSDAVHVRWIPSTGTLELIFGESKIYQSFSKALADAFSSIESFHYSRTKRHEVNAFTAGFGNLGPDLQAKVVDYIEGENASNCRLVQACLLGFDWAEYKCLNDERREAFVQEFESRYRDWAVRMSARIQEKLLDCSHKHLRFEIFVIPFEDVDVFRNWFEEELTGK